MKINMRKFAKWCVRKHADGKIVKMGKNYVIVHGVGVDDWRPCGKNRKYTYMDAKKIYDLLSDAEKKGVDWVKKEM